MINQLHVVNSASSNSGGEGLAAMRYALSLAKAGSSVTLVANRIASTDTDVNDADGRYRLLFLPTKNNFVFTLTHQYIYLSKLCSAKNIDIIHIHGAWSPLLAVASLVSSRKGISLIISPHGCLEPWALRYKYLKKLFALKSYQGAILHSASMFIATAQQELESIRRLGYKQPIAILPNGVDVAKSTNSCENSGVKVILFLSRLHPKKGLLDLVEAWSICRRNGWKIVIAGGDEVGHRKVVENLIIKKGLQNDFEFAGYVEGKEKQACFDSATLFILPTYSENFGIAVAEALAHGVPVITTTETPWNDLVVHKCGWWINPGIQSVAKTLSIAMLCSTEELRDMGKRGRELVISKYSWAGIGFMGLEVCKWLLNQDAIKPYVVHFFEDNPKGER